MHALALKILLQILNLFYYAEPPPLPVLLPVTGYPVYDCVSYLENCSTNERTYKRVSFFFPNE